MAPKAQPAPAVRGNEVARRQEALLLRLHDVLPPEPHLGPYAQPWPQAWTHLSLVLELHVEDPGGVGLLGLVGGARANPKEPVREVLEPGGRVQATSPQAMQRRDGFEGDLPPRGHGDGPQEARDGQIVLQPAVSRGDCAAPQLRLGSVEEEGKDHPFRARRGRLPYLHSVAPLRRRPVPDDGGRGVGEAAGCRYGSEERGQECEPE
jgi:hypothetical protein